MEEEISSPFYHPLKEFLEGGKKVRPSLVLIVHDACKGKGDPLPASAAIELIHAASLIHDDLIDRDVLRRGEGSFHVKNGFEMALLVVDFILSIVLNIASKYENKKIGEALARASKRMSIGEMLEIQALKRAEKISLDEYLEILRLKTAVLFETATSLGALIAGREDISNELGQYGLYLGMAYQIKDLSIDSDIINSLPDDDSTAILYTKIGNKYEGNTIGMVIVQTDDVFKRWPELEAFAKYRFLKRAILYIVVSCTTIYKIMCSN